MLSAALCIFCVLLICLFLLFQGLPPLREIGLTQFLFGTTWNPESNTYGILPMVLASIYVTGGAVVVGVPLGILGAIYLANFCPPRLYRLLKPAVSLMAGIPSIVFGFFGMVIIAPITKELFGGTGKSMLTASLLLGIMILPTIIAVSESSLRQVSSAYVEASLALGASKETSVFYVQLPAARSGILAAVILGIGRAIGETMAVVMVAGNQAIIPASIFKGVRTMTANIVLEMGYATDLHRDALIGTAVVLFVFILLINLLLSAIKSRSMV
jgi:phosphate transport system permease protein